MMVHANLALADLPLPCTSVRRAAEAGPSCCSTMSGRARPDDRRQVRREPARNPGGGIRRFPLEIREGFARTPSAIVRGPGARLEGGIRRTAPPRRSAPAISRRGAARRGRARGAASRARTPRRSRARSLDYRAHAQPRSSSTPRKPAGVRSGLAAAHARGRSQAAPLRDQHRGQRRSAIGDLRRHPDEPHAPLSRRARRSF